MYRIAVMLFCCLVFTAPRLGAEVLFEDDFEGGVLDSTEWVRYIFARGPKAKERSGGFETRAEHVHSGERSFRLTSLDAGGKATGSILSHFFLPGVDKAYFRWYAKFAEDFNQGNQMHWCMLTATRTDDRESAFGKAGQRPNGTDFAIAHLEPSNHWGQYPHPGAMGFYTYFPEMKISKDSGLYYGNRFEPEEPFVIERGLPSKTMSLPIWASVKTTDVSVPNFPKKVMRSPPVVDSPSVTSSINVAFPLKVETASTTRVSPVVGVGSSPI